MAGPGIDTTIPAELLAEARAGDPASIAEVWWTAYWSADDELLREFTADTAGVPLEGVIGWSQYFAALHAGDHSFDVGPCEELLGADAYECSIVSIGSHPVYPLRDGDESAFVVRIDGAAVSLVGLEAFLDRLDVGSLSATLTAYDAARWQTSCTPDAIALQTVPPPAGCATYVREAYGSSN